MENVSTTTKPPLAQRLREEAIKLGAIFLYFAVFLGGLTAYKRLILSQNGINYFQYGYAMFEALVLAKVVMIGELFHLGTKFSEKPLIIPTLHKTLVFGLLVLAFTFAEHLISGLIEGKGLAVVLQHILDHNKGEILAKTIVMLIAFIPLFSIWEISRVLGGSKLADLFFKRKTHDQPIL